MWVCPRLLVLATVAWSLPAVAQVGVIDLGGTWQTASGEAGEDWQECTLPATWTDVGYRETTGLLRFRRTVSLPPRWRDDLAPTGLAVLIGAGAYGSYEVYADGERVAGYGGLDLPLPVPAAQVFALPAAAVGDDGSLRLALHYQRSLYTPARYSDRRGPVGELMLVGDLSLLRSRAALERRRSVSNSFTEMILVVFLIAVALYHLQLYARRRESSEYLWFALLVLHFAAIVFFSNWMRELTPSYSLARRLTEATFHSLQVFLFQFLWSFLARRVVPSLRAFQLSHALLALFALTAPVGWVLVTQLWRWTWALPGWVLMAVLLVGELRRGDSEARIVGLGGLVVSLASIAEWAAMASGWGSTMPLPAWAAGVFALAMTVSLSSRFDRVHRELEGLRSQLEEMVEDRKSELKIANEKLKSEITERRLAQEAIRMLERAVEQSIDGIVVADLEGNIEFVNEAWARFHGYEVHEVVGHNRSLFHSPQQMADEVTPSLETTLENGSFDGEISHRRKDRTTFPTWTSITLVRDGEGEPVGIVAVGRDITERKKAEEEHARLERKVRHANKLQSLGNLAGGIAHDYNNLLTGVLGNSALLQRELPPGSPARAKFRQIENAAVRAADLTAQLLAYAGEDPLAVRSVDLGELVGQMAAELELIAPRNVALALRLNQDVPAVAVDPGQIRRAISHLVENASEALGGAEGTVTVRTYLVDADHDFLRVADLSEAGAPGLYVCLEVADDGCGISDEIRARMFDPFFSTRPSARGLGLATVFGIVRAHRGAIKVRSRPGDGTAFELLFPVAVEEPIPELEPKPDPEPAPHDFDSSATVLVVDDEVLMREVSESILEDGGFKVLTAADGQEALELFRRDRAAIKVVLLDRTMPSMDGEEVFDEIRRLDPEARVILMSGYRGEKAMRGLTDKGLAGFLQKPFHPEDLIRKVLEILDA